LLKSFSVCMTVPKALPIRKAPTAAPPIIIISKGSA
jgi:hypothetical protein